MTDDQLKQYLGIANHPKAQKVVDALTANQRATYERMANIEIEVALWQDGLGPKPQGVLMDFDRKAFR